MSIRKLAGETAIYGIPSIVGRLLYFGLTPYYTRIFSTDEYGIVTDLFAYIGFAMVFFTYRMETAYFRFGTDNNRQTFHTAMSSIILSTLILGGVFALFAPFIADVSSYPERVDLIYMAVGILSLDAINEIPFAKLRLESRARRFAAIRFINICINLGGNLFFLLFCPWLLQQDGWQVLHPVIEILYKPEIGIGYIFLSNLIASGVATLLLLPELKHFKIKIDWPLWKRMVRYAVPLVIVGFSYVVNEMFDRKVMIWLLPGSPEENQSQLGIYGANYKLAMILALFTQAFRYGAEPFFFRERRKSGALQSYADIASVFTLIGVAGFLFVVLYIDILKYFIGSEYRGGLNVVPVLLLANLFLGLYYNFSVWYKITDKTNWGAWISIGGALLTILLNIWWIPIFGYTGAAWATLICYAAMMLASQIAGRRFLDIPYNNIRMLSYLIAGIALFGLSQYFRTLLPDVIWIILSVNTVLMIAFISLAVRLEKELVQRIFKKT